MKKKKKNRSKGTYTTVILFAAAVLLLLGSVAGSSQAALTYYSENYSAELRTFDIGVTLVENGNEVSWRNYTQKDDEWYEGGGTLLSNMLYRGPDGEQEALQLNRKYNENLCVKNSGNIDEYVRVTIYRYWVEEETKADGTPVPLEERKKLTGISPEWIDLDPWDEKNSSASYNGWVLDSSASTNERIVLYYTGVLGTGKTTPSFTDKLSIDRAVEEAIRKTDAGGKITHDNVEFVLEVDVDAVQTHNAVDAIKSAWGVDVTVDADGSLTLRR